MTPNKFALILLAILLSACTVKGTMDEAERKKHVQCTDTRDGEMYSFHASTVTNIRIGFGAESSYDFVDDNGKHRRAVSGEDVYIKCKDI